ncbi:MAG TPA: aspartate-semialdehyde dehydrogenase [Candidatus Glassbacteria bacterium]|nr:aspartate-semialdehyde dehydrogenase [Candidatus Glassbacteria bacterium]
MEKIKVGVLGATGTVGQRFITLLDGHPWFELAEVAASERSSGKTYEEAVAGRWKVSADIPAAVKKMAVRDVKPGLDCQVVFSAMDASMAGPAEEEFAAAGYYVFSNSRNHRYDDDVPILLPEINAEHVAIIEHQQKKRGWKGFIVTNANCSAMGLVIALKPLDVHFGLTAVNVVTMQAISGAGYPGVASLDIIDNVIPYIGGEELKLEREPLKMLGRVEAGTTFVDAPFKISAQCNRVFVLDGHLECTSVSVKKKPSKEEFTAALAGFKGRPQELKLPSAPEQPIIVRTEEDRPQPRFDRDHGRGMSVTVGRIRPCNIFDYKFLVLSHNTVRGAAGASILNAEFLKAEGYF